MCDSYKELGKNACIECIGRDFVICHKETASFSVQEISDDKIYCFLGIDLHADTREISLSNIIDWDVFASCYVENGAVTMDICKLPISE